MKKILKIVSVAIVAVIIATSFYGCTSDLHLTNAGLKYYNLSQAEDNEVTENAEKEKTQKQVVPVLEGKESSYDSPLKIGDTGICDVLESSTQGNQSINIKVNSVVRGEEAKKIVDEYIATNDSVTINELPSTTEYAVVKYDISLKSQDFVGVDALPLIKMNIKGTDGDALEYDNSIYTTLSSFVISNDVSIQSGEVISLESVFAVPIGCKDFIMEFGADNGAKAIFHS